MSRSVELQIVSARTLAAVRREVSEAEVGPALDQVWSFIRTQPGLRTDGHNVFVYHPNVSTGLLECEFGVEVTRAFETVGEVHATETPAGEAAVAVHRGSYDRMNEAYEAIGRWMATNHRESAGYTWEIYGDPTPDPDDTETTVVRLLTKST
jgi:effector-binding domain-containing protein